MKNFEKQVKIKQHKPIFYAKRDERLKWVISIVGESKMNKKEIDKIVKEIEKVGVHVIEWDLNKHLKFWCLNPDTGTVKLVTVSGSPKSKGKYDLIRTSVRKVFRKGGEYL